MPQGNLSLFWKNSGAVLSLRAYPNNREKIKETHLILDLDDIPCSFWTVPCVWHVRLNSLLFVLKCTIVLVTQQSKHWKLTSSCDVKQFCTEDWNNLVVSNSQSAQILKSKKTISKGSKVVKCFQRVCFKGWEYQETHWAFQILGKRVIALRGGAFGFTKSEPFHSLG